MKFNKAYLWHNVSSAETGAHLLELRKGVIKWIVVNEAACIYVILATMSEMGPGHDENLCTQQWWFQLTQEGQQQKEQWTALSDSV